MKRGIEESVGGICAKYSGIFPAVRPPPEITLAKYEDEQCAENIKNREAL